jgi:hypothetical protein
VVFFCVGFHVDVGMAWVGGCGVSVGTGGVGMVLVSSLV